MTARPWVPDLLPVSRCGIDYAGKLILPLKILSHQSYRDTLADMAAEAGLRERKKQKNRQLIFEAASRLFAERGFDAVTVAEVARAADVSEVTVFNYFPTKEDLVFAGLGSFEQRLVDAVRDRGPGEGPWVVFHRLLAGGFGRLAEEGTAAVIAKGAALIGGSRALQVREREVTARYTTELARLLAAETGTSPEDVEAWAVANALMGVHAALVAHTRARVLAGWSGVGLAADARAQAARALARLEDGIGGYAPRAVQTPGPGVPEAGSPAPAAPKEY
jgi:AcrR family transcriptional regulator